jgi:Transmembrane domain of unknown function (DUF3566)
MTETQAMSETTRAPDDPPADEVAKAEANPQEATATPAVAKAAVGRASVPTEQSPPVAAKPVATVTASAPVPPIPPVTPTAPAAAGTTTTTASGTTFTRPAGMPVPGEEKRDGAKPGAPVGRTAMGAAALRSVVNSATAGAVRVTEAVRAARTGVATGASRGPRRARLSIRRIDPWSVMKFSFAVSFVLLVVIIVATAVLYLALDAMGVFDSLNKTLGELFTSNGSASGGFKITAGGVIGVSAILGAINVVLFTALMTLGAFVYNVCADLVGGVEVTLAERE